MNEITLNNIKNDNLKTVMIGIPNTTASYSMDFAHSIFLAQMGPANILNMSQKYGVRFYPHVEGSFPIDANRNKMCDMAINGIPVAVGSSQELIKPDYLIMFDADMTFPECTLDLMLENLIVKKYEVVSGLYFMKKEPFQPVMGRYCEPTNTMYKPIYFWDKGTTFDVDVIGMGCFGCDVNIFKRMEKPFFEYTSNPVYGSGIYKDVSEDMQFCHKAKEAGIKIKLDTRISCGHITKMIVGEKMFTHRRDTKVTQLQGQDKEVFWEKIYDIRGGKEVAPVIPCENKKDWVK